MRLFVAVHVRTVSEANMREHYYVKAKRAREQRALTRMVCETTFGAPPPPPLVITLTRIGVRTLDSDNLAGAFKACRDGVADWLGLSDGDERLTWVVEQRKGKGLGPKTEIEIATREEAT